MTSNSYDNIGPTFDVEQPTRLDFTNNIGGRLDCVARGVPTPNTEWFDNENNPVSSIQNVSLNSMQFMAFCSRNLIYRFDMFSPTARYIFHLFKAKASGKMFIGQLIDV